MTKKKSIEPSIDEVAVNLPDAPDTAFIIIEKTKLDDFKERGFMEVEIPNPEAPENTDVL